MRYVLITGADGFIGSHCVEHFIRAGLSVVAMCSFRTGGIGARLSDSPFLLEAIRSGQLRIVTQDLRAPIHKLTSREIGVVDHIIHFAADSHVDRSLEHPGQVILNNVQCTVNILDFARTRNLKSFIQISTDEVYGAASGDHLHREWEPIIPSNPYAASKAAQEAIAISYWRAYGVPVVITNTMNNIGERQHPEKFFPMIIRNVLNGNSTPVHAINGIVGSRFYLHARNHADACMFILNKPGMIPSYDAPGRSRPYSDRPARFNVVGSIEVRNDELVEMISSHLGKEARTHQIDAHSARPGHDLRYALDGSKLAEAGWGAPVSFVDSLHKTIDWYVDNSRWLAL